MEIEIFFAIKFSSDENSASHKNDLVQPVKSVICHLVVSCQRMCYLMDIYFALTTTSYYFSGIAIDIGMPVIFYRRRWW